MGLMQNMLIIYEAGVDIQKGICIIIIYKTSG